MEQLTEFVSNNIFLFIAWLAVFALLLKEEYAHQTNKAVQLQPSQATRLMNNSSDALVLDIRSADEFAKGHIKGALNIPLVDLKGGTDKLKKYIGKPVLIYCNSGSTSMRAGKILQDKGFDKVNNLAGGISSWKEASLPLTKK